MEYSKLQKLNRIISLNLVFMSNENSIQYSALISCVQKAEKNSF